MMTQQVDNLISGSSAFSKTSLNLWNFMVHVLLKPGLKNFEHYFTSVWDGVHVSFSVLVSSRHIPNSRITGSYGSFSPSFLRSLILSSIVAVLIYIPTSNARGFPFLHTLSSIYCWFFDDGHSNQCEMIPHCSFDLHFSNNERYWAFFHVLISHLYVFVEMSV